MLGDANNPQILSPINTGGGSGDLTKSQADTYYYPLSTNPAGYLTSTTAPGAFLWQCTGSTLSPTGAYDVSINGHNLNDVGMINIDNLLVPGMIATTLYANIDGNGSNSLSIANAAFNDFAQVYFQNRVDGSMPEVGDVLAVDYASGGYTHYYPQAISSLVPGGFYWDRDSILGTLYPTTTTDRVLIGGATDDGTSALQVNGICSLNGNGFQLVLDPNWNGYGFASIYQTGYDVILMQGGLFVADPSGGNGGEGTIYLFDNTISNGSLISQDNTLYNLNFSPFGGRSNFNGVAMIGSGTYDGTSALQVNGDIKDADGTGATGLILYDATLSQYVRYQSVGGVLVGTHL